MWEACRGRPRSRSWSLWTAADDAAADDAAAGAAAPDDAAAGTAAADNDVGSLRHSRDVGRGLRIDDLEDGTSGDQVVV